MTNCADPAETPRFVASHLCLRCLYMLLFGIICINAFATSRQLRRLSFRQATPLIVLLLENGPEVYVVLGTTERKMHTCIRVYIRFFGYGFAFLPSRFE